MGRVSLLPRRARTRAARQPEVPVDARIREFCKPRLPRIGIRLTETERDEWKKAIESRPDTIMMAVARLRGERWMLRNVELLGQLSIGGTPLQFDVNDTTLTTTQKSDVRKMGRDFLERLRVNPREVLTVTGYADNNGGGESYNLKVARQRAEAVVRELRTIPELDSAPIRIAAEVIPVRSRRGDPAARAVALTNPSSTTALAAADAQQARAGGVDVSTVLVGTTEFLLAEAREQVEQYLLRRGTAQLCARAQWREVLPVTCELVPSDSLGVAINIVQRARFLVRTTRDSVRWAESRVHRVDENGKEHARQALISVRQRLSGRVKALQRVEFTLARARQEADATREFAGAQRYFPGVEMLRSAINEDLRTLPYRVSDRALRGIVAGAHASEVRERAVLALYLLRYVEEIGRAETPLNALQSAASYVRDKVPHEETALTVHLRRASELSDLITSARTDLRRYWDADALADSASLYAVKAFILNLPAVPAAEYSDGLDKHIDELLTIAATTQGLVASIERHWKELRELPRDSITHRAARSAIVAQIADEVINLAIAVLPPDSTRLRNVLQPVVPIRELTLALADRNAPQVLNSLVRVGRTIDSNSMLSPDQMRVLAFGTDVVQARTTAEVQGAFERLVSAGPGYQGKRGSAETFWRVNAYAGLTGGGEWLVDVDSVDHPAGVFGALTLPIGVEVGRRTGYEGSHSVFVQALDLGAIASSRINRGDDLEAFPKFSFGSVVAPGVYYVRSFQGSPFVWMAGATYVPQARQTEHGDELGGLRGSLAVAVDIPLFP